MSRADSKLLIAGLIYIYIYTYIHTYIHTYTHTHTVERVIKALVLGLRVPYSRVTQLISLLLSGSPDP